MIFGKKAAALLLIFTMLFTMLTACGSDSADGGETDPAVTGDTGEDEIAYNYNLEEYIKVGQYKGVAVDVAKVTVTGDELADELDYILYSNSTTENITSGTVENGDIVNIDYVGTMDGVAFEGGTDEDFNLTIGSNSFIDGFESGLIGKDIGTTATLNIKFPDPYQNNPDFAGKDVTFTVTLNHKVKLIQPEWSDEFVQSISDEYKTVDEYQAYVKDYLYQYNADDAKKTMTTDAWNKVIDSSEVIKYPDVEYKKYYDEFVGYYESAASEAGVTLEAYISEKFDVTLDEFYGDAEDYAKGYVRDDMIFYYIVRTENIYVSEEEYTAGLQEYFTYYQSYGFTTVQEFEDYYGRNTIITSVLWDKMLQFIADNAVVTEVAA